MCGRVRLRERRTGRLENITSSSPLEPRTGTRRKIQLAREQRTTFAGEITARVTSQFTKTTVTLENDTAKKGTPPGNKKENQRIKEKEHGWLPTLALSKLKLLIPLSLTITPLSPAQTRHPFSKTYRRFNPAIRSFPGL